MTATDDGRYLEWILADPKAAALALQRHRIAKRLSAANKTDLEAHIPHCLYPSCGEEYLRLANSQRYCSEACSKLGRNAKEAERKRQARVRNGGNR